MQYLVLLWYAGQSVVQFAMGPNGKSEVAIKFFLDPTAFYTEAQLYSTFVPEHRGCVTRPACMDTIDPTETYDSSYRVESRQLHNEAPTLSLAVQGVPQTNTSTCMTLCS